MSRVAKLGLIVLQVDETIEQDFRRLFSPSDVAIYVSRVPSGQNLTPQTIAKMEATLPQAVGLLPPAVSFDVIGYACTSGATLIGAARVAELVQGAAITRAVTNPLTATVSALKALGVSSVAVVSPYIAAVAQPLHKAFEHQGVRVVGNFSFGEEVEARVAQISAHSVYEAALSVGSDSEVDAVFLSCTNLHTLDILAPLEKALGKPVISSNQALAWHMASLSNSLPLLHGHSATLDKAPHL